MGAAVMTPACGKISPCLYDISISGYITTMSINREKCCEAVRAQGCKPSACESYWQRHDESEATRQAGPLVADETGILVALGSLT